MAAIDRCILRLAAYELLHELDTPINVIINEAVEIAKKYSTGESSKFVNGILDKIKLERGHGQAEAKKKVQELREKLAKHDYLYYVQAKPEISDTDYDRLYRELVELEKKFPDLQTPDSPTQRVGSELVGGFQTVKHTVPMLSLENAFNENEVLEWTNAFRS